MFRSLKRHYSTILNYTTVLKVYNIFILIIEMQFKRINLHSHPCYIRVEVSPYCNLRCPGCILGGAPSNETNPEHRNDKMMSVALFKKSVESLLPYLVKVNLYDEGEPLLNKNLPAMIRHLHDNKVATCVSTNFSINLSDSYLEELLLSGLDHLIVAVDGITQENYEKYRKGGDLSLVINNLKRIVALQQRSKNSLKIEIQFLEFPHNKQDRLGVAELAKSLGVWRFCVKENSSPMSWEENKFRGTQDERRKRGCYQLWISSTINSIGEIGCCDYGEDHGIPNIGNASEYMEKNLRNHQLLLELRESFKTRSKALHPVCCHCSQYRNVK